MAIVARRWMLFNCADNVWVEAFSLLRVSAFCLFFTMGAVFRLNLEVVHRALDNAWVSLSLFVLSVVPVSINFMWVEMGVSAVRAAFVYMLFYKTSAFWSGGSAVARGLSYIGGRTLEIYLIHFFLLFRLPEFVIGWWDSMNADTLSNGAQCKWLFEYCVTVPVALVIIAACMAIRRAIDCVPIASRICFGPQKKSV